MNRKNVLLVLGARRIMKRLVFGSGAFTQVEADRELSVSVADDSAALLQLEGSSVNSEYTTTTTGGAGANIVTINLDGTNVSGSGINDDAVTNVTPVLNVTNQGTQQVEVTLSGAPTGVNLTNTPLTLNVGQTGQIGIEVAAGNAPRSINGGTLNSTSVTRNITIQATATP